MLRTVVQRTCHVMCSMIHTVAHRLAHVMCSVLPRARPQLACSILLQLLRNRSLDNFLSCLSQQDCSELAVGAPAAWMRASFELPLRPSVCDVADRQRRRRRRRHPRRLGASHSSCGRRQSLASSRRGIDERRMWSTASSLPMRLFRATSVVVGGTPSGATTLRRHDDSRPSSIEDAFSFFFGEQRSS